MKKKLSWNTLSKKQLKKKSCKNLIIKDSSIKEWGEGQISEVLLHGVFVEFSLLNATIWYSDNELQQLRYKEPKATLQTSK